MALTKSSDTGANWDKILRFVNMWGPLPCPVGTAEKEMCDDQRWSGMVQQFAPTGPVCGANKYPEGLTETVPKKKTGCCDASGGAAGALVWAGLAAGWLRRKRG